jgi:hypothetical protein
MKSATSKTSGIEIPVEILISGIFGVAEAGTIEI